jgi:hypothetical protein
MSVKRPDVLPAQHSNVDFMNPQEIGLNSSGLRETITMWRFARFVMVSRESLQEDFDNWRRERELVEAEMNRIIGTVLSGRKEDRTIRAAQFAALIERREAAARKVLPPNDLVKQLRAAAEPNQ